MKKSFFLWGILFVTLSLLNSCKKGENDPFLSLRSRDARITGVWILSEYTRVSTDTFNGSTVTSTYSISNGVDSNGDAITIKWEINKDGTYLETVTDNGSVSTQSGYWYWRDSKKNKVAISIAGSTWTLDRLSNKEMNLYEEYTSSDPGVSSIDTYDYKFVKE